MGRLTARSQELSAGFWLVPGAVIALLSALALVLIQVDRLAGDHGVGAAFGGEAEAARTVLSALAGSLITVAGLTFSIMIVTLQLVSQQYTSRVLRTFLSDRLAQVIAGGFVGIFAYSMLVLRVVRGGGGVDRTFVPSLAVSVAILLGLAALALLIAFIHRMATSIQVSAIAARLSAQTRDRLETLYPGMYGEAAADPAGTRGRWDAAGEGAVVTARRTGFVQAVELDDVAECVGPESIVRVLVRPGDFVSDGAALLEVRPAAAATDGLHRHVRTAVAIADERDLRHDPLFGVRQLADVALRALSPGVNDPSTASTALLYLRAALERLAVLELPPEVRELDGVAVIASGRRFDEFLAVAFDEVGVAAAGQPRLAVEVLAALAAVREAALGAGHADRAAVASRTAARLAGVLRESAPTSADRAAVDRALAVVGAG